MKKTAAVIAVLALVACTTGVLLAQSPEDAKFKKFQDAFWDAYFKFYPTDRDAPGLHEVQRQARGPERRGPRQVQRAARRVQPGARHQDRQDQALRGQPGRPRAVSRLPRSRIPQAPVHPPLAGQPAPLQRPLRQQHPEPARQERRLRRRGRDGPGQAHPRPREEGQGQPQEPAPGIHPGGHRPDAGHPRFLQGRHPQALRRRRGSPGRGRQGRRRPRGLPALPEGRAPGQVDRELPHARTAPADAPPDDAGQPAHPRGGRPALARRLQQYPPRDVPRLHPVLQDHVSPHRHRAARPDEGRGADPEHRHPGRARQDQGRPRRPRRVRRQDQQRRGLDQGLHPAAEHHRAAGGQPGHRAHARLYRWAACGPV